jgi:hypothetical protein
VNSPVVKRLGQVGGRQRLLEGDDAAVGLDRWPGVHVQHVNDGLAENGVLLGDNRDRHE